MFFFERFLAVHPLQKSAGISNQALEPFRISATEGPNRFRDCCVRKNTSRKVSVKLLKGWSGKFCPGTSIRRPLTVLEDPLLLLVPPHSSEEQQVDHDPKNVDALRDNPTRSYHLNITSFRC
ncbi:hypothetical protein Tco_0530796 [Tanacetum coccineum]